VPPDSVSGPVATPTLYTQPTMHAMCEGWVQLKVHMRISRDVSSALSRLLVPVVPPIPTVQTIPLVPLIPLDLGGQGVQVYSSRASARKSR